MIGCPHKQCTVVTSGRMIKKQKQKLPFEKGKHRRSPPTPTHHQCTASAEMFPKKCFTKLSGKAQVLFQSPYMLFHCVALEMNNNLKQIMMNFTPQWIESGIIELTVV